MSTPAAAESSTVYLAIPVDEAAGGAVSEIEFDGAVDLSVRCGTAEDPRFWRDTDTARWQALDSTRRRPLVYGLNH